MKKKIIHRLLEGAILVTVLAALTQTASANTPPLGAPDASSTACLLGLAGTALVAIRRLVR